MRTRKESRCWRRGLPNCKVCFSPLSNKNTLKIENVPSATFKFSGNTVDLKCTVV